MLWMVFGPSLVLAEGFSSDSALQAVLSVSGSSHPGALLVSSVWAASRPPGGCAEDVEVFVASYHLL